MSNNLFARFIEAIKQPGFLISRLIIVGIFTIIFSLSFLEDPFVVYEMYLPIEGEPDEEVSEYLEKFKSEHNKEELAIHWHPSTGTPTAVFGKLAKFDIASEGNAREFLRKNKDLFKFRDNLEDLTLVPEWSIDSPIGKHFVFEQRYKTASEDIKVSIAYGGRVGVSFNNNAEIIAISNTYLPNIKLDSIISKIEQEKNKAKAVAKAILNVKKRVNFNKMKDDIKSELVIYLFNKEIKLSWRFVIYTYKNTWEVFIDAQNKLCLGSPRDINQYYVKGKGEVFNVNPIAATCDPCLDVSSNNLPNNAYKDVVLEGLNGIGYLDGEYIEHKDGISGRDSRPNNDFTNISYKDDIFAELMVYYYVDYTERYVQSLGFKIPKRHNKTKYTFFVEDASSSHYDSSTGVLKFSNKRRGGGRDAEIIIHEYAHAIQDNQIRDFGSIGEETKAIREGFGDYLAISIGSRFVSDCSNTISHEKIGHSCLAEWAGGKISTINRNNTVIPIRCGVNCLRELEDRKYGEPLLSNEAHERGQIWSFALWELNKRVGNDNANKIILESHNLIKGNPKASFNEAADAIVTAAKNLQNERRLNGRINIDDVISVLKDRKFTLGLFNNFSR